MRSHSALARPRKRHRYGSCCSLTHRSALPLSRGELRPRASAGGLGQGMGSSDPGAAPTGHRAQVPGLEDRRAPAAGAVLPGCSHPFPSPLRLPGASRAPQPRSPRLAAAANAAGGREEPRPRPAWEPPRSRPSRETAGAVLRSAPPPPPLPNPCSRKAWGCWHPPASHPGSAPSPDNTRQRHDHNNLYLLTHRLVDDLQKPQQPPHAFYKQPLAPHPRAGDPLDGGAGTSSRQLRVGWGGKPTRPP